MDSSRLTVFFPCHNLDDFPPALEPREVDDLLAAWTAAWHPALIAACGTVPDWAPVDLGLPDTLRLGIVPAAWDDRFTGQVGPEDAGRLVRGLRSAAAIAAEAAGRCGLEANESALPGGPHAEDFRGLGLAVLLSELLARRMRTEAGINTTGFGELVVEAARGAVARDDETVRDRLAEAFACLEATRARYYPVESWAVDVVLLFPGTLATDLASDLASPVPLAVVASGETIRQLADRWPGALAPLREAVAQGHVEPCGGRTDEEPLDRLSPEAILASFTAGREAWLEHLGAVPRCHAAITGGSSAVLPQLLTGLGYRSAIWSQFDGSSLPDPHSGRILWEGSGGASIEAVAGMPLDASRSGSVLAIPGALGDAMDRDHVAVLQFASCAGAASEWHLLVRRIGRWSSLLGTFVTPSNLVERTTGVSTTIAFEPDAFPSALPVDRPSLGGLIEANHAAAAGTLAAAQSLQSLLPGAKPVADPLPSGSRSRTSFLAGLFSGRRRAPGPLLLDHGFLRVEPHPRTGGLLSLRRPQDPVNRLSQQLALRTTTPVRGRWEPPEERAVFTRMEAESVRRAGDAVTGRIETRGRLLDTAGRPVGRFTQQVSLVPGLPLVIIDIEVALEHASVGALLEEHVACRFAWHENEEVELWRSLHLQAVATERTRFPAAHFIRIAPAGARLTTAAVTILTGGLPWHVRSSPHVLDCVLPETGRTAACRLAVGVGIERPWEAAVSFAAGQLPAPGPPLPANLRLTGPVTEVATGESRRFRLGILESAGQAGEVRIEWGGDVLRAQAIDSTGRPRPDVHVAVDGQSTVLWLAAYQWLHLELEFVEPLPNPVGGLERSA